jgi:hypothetical protein
VPRPPKSKNPVVPGGGVNCCAPATAGRRQMKAAEAMGVRMTVT